MTKLNAAGTAVLYSTYLGGNELDIGQGIAVDSSGSAYVCGSTRSNSFPTTPGALQPTFGGASDAFMTKLNAAGSGLVYSTYLGGSFDDQAIGIALDSTDSVYVAGSTYSADFPITPGSFQPVVAGQANAFVAKLNAAGSALVYSTALGAPAGGSGLDSVVRGIAVDTSGAAYVTGDADAPDFPTTPGSFQMVSGGGRDAFVTKLNPSGSAPVYSTFLGGGDLDNGVGIAVDSAGSAYVVGDTASADFPTQKPFQSLLDGFTDAFVTKLNPSGSSLVYSTYLGGSGGETGYAIAVDAGGHVYVGGQTLSFQDFPTKAPVQSGYGGGETDGFVARLNTAGDALDYSTYLGGNSDDVVVGLGVDAVGSVYVVGGTQSTDFPTTPGAFQPNFAGSSDGFVTKIVAATDVPSFVVNTTDDSLIPGDGKTSLREAITFANAAPGNIITFDPAVFPAGGTAKIQLIDDALHRTLELKANVTIVGPGAVQLPCSGAGRFRTSACSWLAQM